MEKKSSGFLEAAAAILIKDIRSEFRTRYAINALVMFSLVTLTMVSMAIGKYNMESDMSAAFLWIIIFFSLMIAEIVRSPFKIMCLVIPSLPTFN